jgi:hypothetical protein
MARQAEGGAPPRTISVTLGIWYDEDMGHIHLAAPGSHWFHSTVSGTPGSVRAHPNLYRKLSRLLAEAGVPYPVGVDEGE